MSERKILKDKQINRFKLDEEAAVQPDMFHYWAKEASIARRERDDFKNQLKEAEGKVQIAIFTGKYPIPKDKDGKPIKLTNPIVAAIVDTDEDVCVGREDLAIAEEKLSKAAAAETAMEHRRSMIKVLMDLFTKEYYSPIHEGNAPNRNRGDEVSDGQREGLKKSRRTKNTEE